MAKWHFWGEKEFSDVYENIYIRALTEDWFGIVSEIVREIDSVKATGRKQILDVGCGSGRLMKVLKENEEYEVCGVDNNILAVQVTKNKDLDASLGFMGKLKFDDG